MDNGILTTRCHRWPLLIDPQLQGKQWVKKRFEESGLRVLQMSDPGLLRALEHGIRAGSAVLIEDVGETLEPALEPLLLRQTFMQVHLFAN